MNEYWDTSTDAALIATRLEDIAHKLERLIEILERKSQTTTSTTH